ncbi:MAG: homoaconitase [Fidelibacterota bacterium]
MQNLIEKIAQLFAVELEPGQEVRSGDYISIQPAHVLTHDNTGAVMNKFRSIGAQRIANPRQPVFALDHNIQDESEENRKKYDRIEQFATDMGVDFFPAGRGIGHQIICEEGYAWPGTLVVASDSHANMYGGLGCLGTPVVRTDAAAIWATGQTWWQVPPVVRVELLGELPHEVTGKDVIITLCGMFNNDEVLNHALEFTGDGIAGLSIEGRLTIANMSTEWGALAGVFPVDAVTLKWLRTRITFIGKRGLTGMLAGKDTKNTHPRLNEDHLEELVANIIKPDQGAFYAAEITLDLTTIRPHCAGPDNVKTISPVVEMGNKGVKIDKAYLVSCVNSRVSDLAEAAEVVRGKKVNAQVDFYIAAASSEVLAESKRRGDWQTLLDAGATPLPSGCGPCIGLGIGLLEDGEVGISATNRNFKGRMGSRHAMVYLASPAVVAASAISGEITAPVEYEVVTVKGTYRKNERSPVESPQIGILNGFPEKLIGQLIFCPQDNLNTDGIFPGKYTYIDDFPPEAMARVVMKNYDPSFGDLVQKGDILVGGYNFGTGSSREQAATALKYCGIQGVIAGSFSQTYARNALNNGFMLLQSPELVDELKRRLGDKVSTIRPGLELIVDFVVAKVQLGGQEFSSSIIGKTAQELILVGGLEAWVGRKLSS